jgi:hypothetical protein
MEKRRLAARRFAALLFIAAACVGFAAAAQDKPAMKLFKVVTAKDDVVIGLSEPELRALGAGPDIDALAQKLVAAGQLTAWQYAVKKGSDGALVQAPLRRVAIFKSDTLRIEPYNPAPLKIEPPEGAQ